MNILNPSLVHQIFRGISVADHHLVIVIRSYYIIPLIYPFIVGWIIALLLNPVVNFFQFKLKFPDGWPSPLSMFFFLA